MKIDDFQYQDIRVYGETVSRGTRECESRYEAIKPFLERYKNKKSFTVLDFGANYGYFSWRIKEDYPNAQITMVDSRELLKLLYKINSIDGVNLISKYMDENEIKCLEQYDLILLMSVLHHFENPAEIFDIFYQKGETILCEADYPDHPNFTGRQEQIHEHLITKNPAQINKWLKHDRPIYYFNKEEVVMDGVIWSGAGLAKESMKWLDPIFDYFNLTMFPGTLNVGLFEPIEFNTQIRIHDYELIPVYLNGLPVLALRYDVPERSRKRLELISPYNLRNLFNLQDEDIVTISIEKRFLGPLQDDDT